ncbi:hypothetical protein ABS71_22715 [bacterium SCN 62-11]|nr:hypothetical protein [Candidatus Eremiobacteraeota bacterium]ODT55638.1 MAG: hypothetical protein ABS71_22715 [bacterium SCN 62-11]
MRYKLLLGLALVAGCGSSGSYFSSGGSSTGPLPLPTPDRRYGRYFAVIEGALSDGQPSARHRLQLDAGLFHLPSGQVTLMVELDGDGIQLNLGESSKGLVTRLPEGLAIVARTGDTLEFVVSGRGDYRLLVSLAGDRDGDGDVDLADGPAGLNFGVSTTVRPLSLHFALRPGPEPLSQLGESLDATAYFSGHSAPGARVQIQSVGNFTADALGDFSFQAPLVPGTNEFQGLAVDDFGQQVEASSDVDQVAESSDPPAAMSDDKKNRIWLLDVHANNYLFRGPLPLTSLDDNGRVDFASLIEVMNERLLRQGAPISALPLEFDFTEIALITNQATSNVNRGDEGFSLHQIYRTILGSDPAWPPVDTERPTSLFTRPLDNTSTAGVELVVQGHTLHPDVIWQPVSGSVSGKPKPKLGGDKGADTVASLTCPIVSIAPAAPALGLSEPLSNVSRTTRLVHSLMERPSVRPHIYYLHCVNGHDRTGMIATAYVLSAYGPSFGYKLGPAYEYGQMGAYLDGKAPAGVATNRNLWDKLEQDNEGTGALKKKYWQAVQALAYLYKPEEGIQEVPSLTTTVPSVPLWQKGYRFAESAGVPTVETPADFQHIRP